MLFNTNRFGNNFAKVKILSPSGNLYEAAANLFAFLHELENSGVELILAEKPPLTGLGFAILDRLTKAVNHYR